MNKLIIMMASALAVLGVVPSHAAEQYVADAKTNCAAEWTGDYAMQAYCIEKQMNGLSEVADMYDPDASPEHVRQIVGHCIAEWPGQVASYDWAMVAYCMRKQLASYTALSTR